MKPFYYLYQMPNLDIDNFLKTYPQFKEDELNGRYINIEMIEPLIHQLNDPFRVDKIGQSYEGRPIYSIKIGHGAVKILIWSQMHGNESTGTKAIFDLLRYFKMQGGQMANLLGQCSFTFIPMLNPDGAAAYTRVNAQGMDLNRDIVNLSAPESSLLKKTLIKIDPEFCFNLHDQRTIFSIGLDHQPATLSFLAPSVDFERTITAGRKVTMNVIGRVYDQLSAYLPQQIGRYSDEFYPTATGDNFEKMGHHTILVESGHYLDDYKRERVRNYTALAVLLGFEAIVLNNEMYWKTYLEIPNIEKNYLDAIYRNVYLMDREHVTDLGVQYREELCENEVKLVPMIEKTGDLSNMMANKIVDINNKSFENQADFLDKMEKNQENV